MQCTIFLALFAAASGFVVPQAKLNSAAVAAASSAVAPARFAMEPTMMARAAPAKKPLKKVVKKAVAKKPVKKVVKKPVKKVVKKPVKKVVKKPVKKIVKKAGGKTSYAMAQRNTVGGGSGAVTGLLNEIVGTLLTPTQLAFIGVWVVLILKYLIFY